MGKGVSCALLMLALAVPACTQNKQHVSMEAAVRTDLMDLPSWQAEYVISPIGSGWVTGIVTDADGKPVQGVQVFAALMYIPCLCVVQHTKTDTSGHFELKVGMWGRYALYASSDHHGDAGGRAHHRSITETVTLLPQHPTAAVSLKVTDLQKTDR